MIILLVQVHNSTVELCTNVVRSRYHNLCTVHNQLYPDVAFHYADVAFHYPDVAFHYPDVAFHYAATELAGEDNTRSATRFPRTCLRDGVFPIIRIFIFHF